VLQPPEKPIGVNACDVEIVFYRQLKNSVVFDTFKVFKGVFVFLKQALPENNAVMR
jgi:hypothetical protein